MVALAAFLFLCYIGYKIVMWFVNIGLKSHNSFAVSEESLQLFRRGLMTNSPLREGFITAVQEEGFMSVEDALHLAMHNDGWMKTRLSLLKEKFGLSEQQLIGALREECKTIS
jgi:hypothetical protein